MLVVVLTIIDKSMSSTYYIDWRDRTMAASVELLIGSRHFQITFGRLLIEKHDKEAQVMTVITY